MDFCVSTLYHATLLNSFIDSSSFLLESLGISVYNIMSFEIVKVLCLPYQCGSLSFSCLVAMAMTSTFMLNKSDESGHLCLVVMFTKTCVYVTMYDMCACMVCVSVYVYAK